MKIYDLLFYICFKWQTSILKEKELQIPISILTFSGIQVLFMIIIYAISITVLEFSKTLDKGNLVGFFFITVLIFTNYTYFTKKRVDNICRNFKNLSKKGLYLGYFLLIFIALVFISIPLWVKI